MVCKYGHVVQKLVNCFIKIHLNGEIVVERNVEHNHEYVNSNILNRDIIRNSAKRKAIEDISEYPWIISIHSELNPLRECKLIQVTLI